MTGRSIPMQDDAIVACSSLVGLAGASGFEIGCAREDGPAVEAGWFAVAVYQGTQIKTGECQSPALAAMALSDLLLARVTCRCGQPVVFTGAGLGCRWRRAGNRWEPGCLLPPLVVNVTQYGPGPVAGLRPALDRVLLRDAAMERRFQR